MQLAWLESTNCTKAQPNSARRSFAPRSARAASSSVSPRTLAISTDASLEPRCDTGRRDGLQMVLRAPSSARLGTTTQRGGSFMAHAETGVALAFEAPGPG